MAAILYAALRIVKNFIRPSFIGLQSAAYAPVKVRGKNIPMSPKNQAAVDLGRKGGKATAKNRTAKQRQEAARKAIAARWAKAKKKPPA